MASNRYQYAISQSKRLEKLLNQSIEKILKKLGEDTVHKVKVFIKQYWYDRYSPLEYERLEENGGLLGAVSYTIEDNSVRIHIDESKLIHASAHLDKYNQGFWGQHRGFDGKDFGEGLIEFVENGRFDSGRVGSTGNPRIGHGSGAIQKTINWLNKYLDGEVKRMIELDFGSVTKK